MAEPTDLDRGAPPARGRSLPHAPAWFWLAVFAGACARLALAWFSAGTTDVELWTQHAAGVSESGLSMHYARSPAFNHPPPVAWAMARLFEACSASGVPFAAAFRSFVALGDLVSAWLLWVALRGTARRELCVALYLVAPLALALAGQHGNTDALIGTCLVGAVLCAGRRRAVWTGVLLGVSAWIKLPGLLAAPGLAFALPRWRERVLCGATTVLVAGLGFAPEYFAAQRFAELHASELPAGLNVMVERVFGYQGWYIRTLGDPPTFVFGLKNLFFRAFGYDLGEWPAFALWWLDLRQQPVLDRSRFVALGALLLLAWLRRRKRATLDVAATLAWSFALFHALVETWTFQYFAWSMALWMLVPLRAACALHVVAGGFLYAVYAYLCSDATLLARWDFVGHRDWPEWLKAWRDVANLTLLALGVAALTRSLQREVEARRAAAE